MNIKFKRKKKLPIKIVTDLSALSAALPPGIPQNLFFYYNINKGNSFSKDSYNVDPDNFSFLRYKIMPWNKIQSNSIVHK